MGKGRFIVFEGGDCAGKTTQVNRLSRRLRVAGIEHIVTRQPGGTKTGDVVRSLLLDTDQELDYRCEALLYSADKAQHLAEVVRPALDRGVVVLCDRYVDSMLAYQGFCRGIATDELEALARWATSDMRPDLTVLLDVDPSQAVEIKGKKDRLESAGNEFHTRVRQGFLDLASRDPQRYLVLNARDRISTISDAISVEVAKLLGLESL